MLKQYYSLPYAYSNLVYCSVKLDPQPRGVPNISKTIIQATRSAMQAQCVQPVKALDLRIHPCLFCR